MSGSPFSLAGRQVLVTGAASAIGAATAALCARMGARLVLCDTDAARLSGVLDTLEGGGHAVLPGDLHDPAARQALVDALPAVDACVFAASAGSSATSLPVRGLAQAQLDTAFALNVDAPLLLTGALLAADKIRNHASLVYVTGAERHWAFGGSAARAAGQAALHVAVRALAVELAGQGIRANCVAPGPLDTAQPEGAHAPAPLGPIAAEDVAAGIAYLLAPASRWVSRASLAIDGGLSLHVR
ncbi:MAG: SDR family oxidoreductase [Janthinobacterium lividum]